ncbi:hypothetical protein, partial [Aeromonas taiwanensis]
MTILRGVKPILFQAHASQPQQDQLIAALQKADQLEGIHSLLISRLDSLEGAGHEDVCRLVSLTGVAPQPVPVAPT